MSSYCEIRGALLLIQFGSVVFHLDWVFHVILCAFLWCVRLLFLFSLCVYCFAHIIWAVELTNLKIQNPSEVLKDSEAFLDGPSSM